MLNAFSRLLTDIAQDDSVRVVILAANGKAFCSDITWSKCKTNSIMTYQHHPFTTCSGVMQQIRQLPQPVIAKVQGIATAAGCQLAIRFGNMRTWRCSPPQGSGHFAPRPQLRLTHYPPKVSLNCSLQVNLCQPMRQQTGFINKVVPQDERQLQIRWHSILPPNHLLRLISVSCFINNLTCRISEAYTFASQTMPKIWWSMTPKKALMPLLISANLHGQWSKFLTCVIYHKKALILGAFLFNRHGKSDEQYQPALSVKRNSSRLDTQ